MISDILMALIVAILIEMVSLNNKYMKRIMTSIICLTNIIAYFLNGNKFNFIGTMDYSIWIFFVILFNILLSFITDKIIKEYKKKSK